jgi:hypothetical protein
MWPLTQDGSRRARPCEVVKRKGKGMKIKKEPIDPARLRTVPRGGFSWIDRRFVRIPAKPITDSGRFRSPVPDEADRPGAERRWLLSL